MTINWTHLRLLLVGGAVCILAGCDSGSIDMKAARECTERRFDALSSRVAAQDISDEQMKAIADQCVAENSRPANSN